MNIIKKNMFWKVRKGLFLLVVTWDSKLFNLIVYYLLVQMYSYNKIKKCSVFLSKPILLYKIFKDSTFNWRMKSNQIGSTRRLISIYTHRCANEEAIARRDNWSEMKQKDQ